ncbi:MAG TPA: glycoside hydrolase family 3 N-terminal domain-containing protein, partial [Anaerolineaceae bacterium]|nr:glycoside hydrolase family 3 N-terminal domain-containing protein [Anaerolineaceae bacterium]
MSLFKTFSWLLVVALLIGLLPASAVQAAPHVQSKSPEALAAEMLQTMTAEEKVGQLFLVTFNGRDIGPSSQIYDLVTRYHIGGVVLRAENDNFSGPQGTVLETYTLNAGLQTLEWQNTQTPPETPPGSDAFIPAYIPLFIGISQEGDGYPYDQILSGMSSLPSQMSIGATWSPELAAKVATVAGRELSALGINLFFGPSLDVLDFMTTSGDDLGSRTFGGDPYWVGRMGQEYIRGLHQGSLNRLMVVAKHFPGRGGSDRPPETEVATVRKSLEQLKQIELAPFFAVTSNATSPEMTTDGLLVSHIRYQGFQGNIRATTRPVSLDQAALELILGLPEFNSWRANGGIVVSDDLGSLAVRRFYDPTGASFDPRQVARTAFQAGNDLLYVDNLAAPDDPDSYTAIVRTLTFFAQKYREDSAFKQRVDASVQRLLTVKYRMYTEFTLEQVLPAQSGLSQVGNSQQESFDVAREAASLISPSRLELFSVLPEPPGLTDRVVFLTDTVTYQQCSRCANGETIAVDALQSAVLRLYGPRAGGMVQGNYLISYSFDNLAALLSGDAERAGNLEEDLRMARWVVISMTDVRAARSSSLALRRLFAERPKLLTDKKVVVFALAAPYYLD